MSNCCGGCAEGSSYIINVAPCVSGCSEGCACSQIDNFPAIFADYICNTTKHCASAYGEASSTPDCTYTGEAYDDYGDPIEIELFPPNSSGNSADYWLLRETWSQYEYWSSTEGCAGLWDTNYQSDLINPSAHWEVYSP